MLTHTISGIGGIVGGVLMMLTPRTSKTKYAKWANKTLIMAGTVAIVWGVLILTSFYGSNIIDPRFIKLMDHYRTFLGGLWLGVILTLLFAGQFKRVPDHNQAKESNETK